MKRPYRLTTVLVVVAFIAAVAGGCGSKRKSIEELAGNDNEIRIYEVFGMDCPGCHGGVEGHVNRLEGVVTSQANWELQRLTVLVSTSARVTDLMIFDAIRRANFTPGKRVR